MGYIEESKKRLEKQVQYLSGFFHAKGLNKALKSMHLAISVHTGERKGGQPEVSHQFELVSVLLPIFEQHDKETVDTLLSAAFLHDLLEDYGKMYEEAILEIGGSSLLDIVWALSKWKGFQKTEDEYFAYYESMSEVALAAIIKGADRMHNLESMLECPEIFDKKKREKYIQETEKYVIPALKKERKSSPQLYQGITLIIRELKVYIKFIKKINELDD